jgi:predicted small secreted protein
MKHGQLVSLALVVPALLLAACGGNNEASTGGAGSGGGGSGAGGTGSAVTVDCTADPGSTPNDISDFEDGAGSVLPNDDRNGGWYTYVDPTATCMVTPMPKATAGAGEIAGMRCASGYAMHFTGTGCTTWGAGVGTDLKAPAATDGGTSAGPKVPYDVSGYTGISFWVRADKGAAMRFKMPMTDETKVEDGGACVESATNKCSDNFGVNVPLTKNWVKKTVMFSMMKQEAWGKAFTWNPAHVTSIQFQVPASAAFDVWIDDVAFIK